MSSRAAPSEDQALEQARRARFAETRDGRRGGDGVVGEERLERPPLRLGAQFCRGGGEPGRPPRQVLRQIKGGERRSSVAHRGKLAPAGFARARPPSLARGAAREQLAGEERQRRWPAEAPGQRGVGRPNRQRLGVGLERGHRSGGRGRADRRRPPAHGRLPERDGQLRSLLRVERRLQVGSDGGEALGAERIAAVGEHAEGGIDPSRRPKLLTRFGEGDRVPERRLVLAPVEQVCGHRGGAFERQAAAPNPSPRRVGSDDGIERRKRRAGEKKRLRLRMLARRAVRARPSGGAGRFEGNGLDANHRANRTGWRRL